MLYELNNAVKNIRRNLTIYILLGLEISIATAFVVTSLNAVSSAEKRLVVLEKQFTPNTIVIRNYTSGGSIDINNKQAFGIEDLNYINKTLNADVQMNIIRSTIFETDSELVNIPIIFTSRLASSDGKVLIGNKVKNLLKNNSYLSDEEGIIVINNSLSFHNKIFSNELVENVLQDQYLTVDIAIPDIDLGGSIIFPLDAIDSSSSLIGNIVINPKQDLFQYEMNDILDYLQSNHLPMFSYSYFNMMDSFNKAVEDLNANIKFFGKISYIILLQLILGFSGIIILFMKRHEKDIAIKIALGAKKIQIIFELYAEIFIFCFVGWAIGYFIGHLMILQLNKTTSVINYVNDMRTALISALTIIGVSIFSSIPIYYKIARLLPYEILSQ